MLNFRNKWAQVCSVAFLASTVSAQTTAPVDYSAVQPVLAERCYSCHGPKSQMGNLRLDAKSVAMKTIKPGHSAESSLYQRIAGIGDQARMPMGGKPLTPDQIGAIKAWIDAGAVWPEDGGADASIQKHWAYIAPKRPAPPLVADKSWVRNPIDNFILARLEKEALKPSPEADRATLLRRLSLDLVGLPPSPKELDAFLKDRSPNAYEKQVDRLLGSVHYGERQARHWLDAARYADSDGYEKDKQRNVWFYRDWVINAFNRDLPYDRFVIDQIAGDLVAKPTQDQLVATGFLRNSMINEEGGVDPEQFRMEAMFDRMDAIGKSVLGVTIQCAQCHNHKYDPLKQSEYYGLFAFLNNSHEANVAVYTPAEQQKRAELFRRMREIETDLQHRSPDWTARMREWESRVTNNQPDWTVVKPDVDDISTGGQKYVAMPDGSLLAQGYAPTKHRVKLTFKAPSEIRAFRLEVLTDPNLPLGGPGRSLKGTGALTEFEVEEGPGEKPKKVKIVRASADANPQEAELEPIFNDKTGRHRVTGPIGYAIDGKEETAWGTDMGPGRRNQPREAVFIPEAPIPAGAVLHVYLNQKHGGWNSDDNQSCNLGRMRLSVTSAPDAVADPVPASVREVLAVPFEKRSPAQIQAVFRHWRTKNLEWKEQNEAIEALWREHPEGSSQLVLDEREKLRPTHLLTRGDFLKPAEIVPPSVPSFLHPLRETKPNRLSFAKWLVSRESPTTARSFVNRVWQTYFGTGIVATSEDLGRQSEAPSHPELLDWLAVEFMDSGWKMKHLHRLIVTSAAYRQSSRVSPELYSKDPYNRLIARGARFRVEGEIVRDITLAASGLLNPEVGGPSVYPPAPDFLFLPPVSYGPKNWHEEEGDDRYRRALYTFRYRSVPYPMLQTFDAPNGDMSCVRRARSNTPLQALTTLNEPLFVEAAQALALKTLREGGATDADRLRYMFVRCLSRPPAAGESDELLSFLDKQKRRLTEGWISAKDLAGTADVKKLPEGTTPVHAAAWTAVSRVLLNLDETITKE